MTRKAHNVDKHLTENFDFVDERSYWTKKGHVYLFGTDVLARRRKVYDLAEGKCNACGVYAGVDGELDHIKGGNTDDRCWCLHNLQWLCVPCHRAKHVQTKFRKSLSTETDRQAEIPVEGGL